jgi:hypothetical protein
MADGAGVAREGAQPYFGRDPRLGSGVGDMLFDGVIPLGEALRALGLSGPSITLWRQEIGVSRPRRI